MFFFYKVWSDILSVMPSVVNISLFSQLFFNPLTTERSKNYVCESADNSTPSWQIPARFWYFLMILRSETSSLMSQMQPKQKQTMKTMKSMVMCKDCFKKIVFFVQKPLKALTENYQTNSYCFLKNSRSEDLLDPKVTS